MSSLHVGCCITAHGFGHGARTMAVMEALADLCDLQLTVATMVPEWFLQESFSGFLTHVPVQTDVGIVQRSPLEEDIPATLKVLADFYPVRPAFLDKLASILSECDMVVCDISPAGILAAQQAGIPSVLVENFTWDWIYSGYRQGFPGLDRFIHYLSDVFHQADFRIQTRPVCVSRDCDLEAAPVARPFRMSRGEVRERLGIGEGQQCVLISMGGILLEELPLDKLQHYCDIVFIISGFSGARVHSRNIRYLEVDSDLFHPDIVRASDAVIGKVGYSTIAEVYHANVPFGYVKRSDFLESGPLVSFITEQMQGLEIDHQAFVDGLWLALLPQLLQMNPEQRQVKNGAQECAAFLASTVAKG